MAGTGRWSELSQAERGGQSVPARPRGRDPDLGASYLTYFLSARQDFSRCVCECPFWKSNWLMTSSTFLNGLNELVEQQKH